MQLPTMDFELSKGRIVLIVAGVVFLFLALTFVASYYEYNKNGPDTETPVSFYDDTSFERLHQELTKDKPKNQKSQKDVLADIAGKDEERRQNTRTVSNTDGSYRQGTLDTLAVNCAILLEQYKALVIKNHELEKQLAGKKKAKPTTRKKWTSSRSARKTQTKKSTAGFDYTRYIRNNSQNELLNQSSGGSRNDALKWVTLSLSQQQKVFDQSVVSLDVTEAFDLDGISVPTSSTVEGVAQVSRGRGRVLISFNRIYTNEQTINIEGDAYSVDRSRGLQVFLQGESTLAEGLKREATDLVGLLDPSRTNVARSLIQDPDLGREVFATLDAGTMVLANIRRR